MLTIEIQNISEMHSVSNYQYIVRRNHKVLERGQIKAFPRPLGWRHLLLRLLQAKGG